MSAAAAAAAIAAAAAAAIAAAAAAISTAAAAAEAATPAARLIKPSHSGRMEIVSRYDLDFGITISSQPSRSQGRHRLHTGARARTRRDNLKVVKL